MKRMKTLNGKNRLKDESGIITLDFIFALSLAGAFAVIFFAMSFALSMVEMSQYVTFASARSFHAANVSEQAQIELGRKKYAELKGSGVIKQILSTGWIELGDIQFGNFTGDYPENDSDSETFVGARVPFRAAVLNMRFPLLGGTADEASTGRATLNAFLMREVSTDECRENFTAQRFTYLKQLGYQSLPPASQEALITDNGC